jgi:transposase
MIGLDLAKNVIQAHGADAQGHVLFRRKLRRAQLMPFLAGQPRCTVAMEACGGAHHVARAAAGLGHTPKLAPPHYVKPFAKRGKSDRIDAEAIVEACQRPNMRFVAVKSAEQQAAGVVFRARDLLVRQRTQTINALRGHLAEFGLVAPKGRQHTPGVLALIEDAATPEAAQPLLKMLGAHIGELDVKIAELDRQIARRARADAEARRLMTIPGVGPVLATAFVALAPAPESFANGRGFAAWIGATPLQRATGGREKIGRTSKMGERTLRRLFLLGAAARVASAVRFGCADDPWLERLLQRKPRMLAIVALANKMARIAWAVAMKKEVYRAPVAA